MHIIISVLNAHRSHCLFGFFYFLFFFDELLLLLSLRFNPHVSTPKTWFYLEMSIWCFDWCPRAAGGGQSRLVLLHAHSQIVVDNNRLEPIKSQSEECRKRRVEEIVSLAQERRDAMDHIGILGTHLQQHTHVEPISFGIDQILSNVEHSCMLGMKMPEADYVHPAYGGNSSASGFTCGESGYSVNASSCGMASLSGAYHMNMCMNANGTNNSANAAGVIRVPAHRPLSCGSASVPQVGGSINTMSTLTFPWMESNRRYTKDRFTGRFRFNFNTLKKNSLPVQFWSVWFNVMSKFSSVHDDLEHLENLSPGPAAAL